MTATEQSSQFVSCNESLLNHISHNPVVSYSTQPHQPICQNVFVCYTEGEMDRLHDFLCRSCTHSLIHHGEKSFVLKTPYFYFY